MKKYVFMSLFMALIATTATLVITSCNQQKDLTPPEISDEGFLPADCDIYYLGDTILVHFVCSDNVELGNYNIEIHNNFDHHTHGTSSVECPMDAEKKPVNPWVYNQDFTIPSGQRTYTARHDIAIPADIDPGDYHFMVRLTDRAGWQQLHAVAIKITE